MLYVLLDITARLANQSFALQDAIALEVQILRKHAHQEHTKAPWVEFLCLIACYVQTEDTQLDTHQYPQVLADNVRRECTSLDSDQALACLAGQAYIPETWFSYLATLPTTATESHQDIPRSPQVDSPSSWLSTGLAT